jgi:AcrR family transcriptional regulator
MDKYHHGDLRQALIEATEALLVERGADAFSLREVARRAGVSPAAPAHHFGDAAGLLTSVATLAFDGLARALREGEARGNDPRSRLREQGVGYVEFAMRHPARFRLMFSAVLRPDEDLERSGNSAFGVLENGVRAAFAIPAAQPLSEDAWTALLALWSVVHGYAHLAIAGRLEPCAGGEDLKRFAARTLRPMLDRVIDGVLSAPRTAAKKRRSRSAR